MGIRTIALQPCNSPSKVAHKAVSQPPHLTTGKEANHKEIVQHCTSQTNNPQPHLDLQKVYQSSHSINIQQELLCPVFPTATKFKTRKKARSVKYYPPTDTLDSLDRLDERKIGQFSSRKRIFLSLIQSSRFQSLLPIQFIYPTLQFTSSVK